MFEITLSTREFDSEARAVLCAHGGAIKLLLNIEGTALPARDDCRCPLIRVSFPTKQHFLDAMIAL